MYTTKSSNFRRKASLKTFLIFFLHNSKEWRRDRKPYQGGHLYNESTVYRIRGGSLNCSCSNNAQTGFVLVFCITFQHCPGGSWMVSWNDIGRVSHFSQFNHNIHQHFHFTKNLNLNIYECNQIQEATWSLGYLYF